MLFEKGTLVLPASEVLGHIVGSVRSRSNLNNNQYSLHIARKRRISAPTK
jgi:hypothetical protein